MSRVTDGVMLFGDFWRAVTEPARVYGGWFSHDMRTFFRDKFSDPAALADLMVFGGREQAEFHGIEVSQNPRIKLLEVFLHLINHSERLRCLQGPAGPGPGIMGSVSFMGWIRR